MPSWQLQAVKAALMALQRHYKDQQTDWQRQRYDCEEALKQHECDIQESSEAILQLQHQARASCKH